MAIRFRKSVKIMPGVRVNFGKKGISTSIGGRGATVNISKRGTRVTAGLPGTGLSASHLYKSPAKKRRVAAAPPEYSPAEWAVAAISLEVIALLFWKHLSGFLSFAGAAIALIIPGIYIVRRIIKQREETLMAKELAELARERAEIEAKATPKPPVYDGSPATAGKHWTEIVKEHNARHRPARPLPAKLVTSVVRSPIVTSKPTFEHATQSKHDLDIMLECCEAEARSYWSQPENDRMCAAPYYFERVAILRRKAKDYVGEIDICNQWKAIIQDYRRQPMVKSRQAVPAHKGPRSEAILARLPKAHELLRKQKAAAKSSPKA